MRFLVLIGYPIGDFVLFGPSKLTCIHNMYSKELSQWDGSFEHQQQMFNPMDKKIFTIVCSNLILLIWTDDKVPLYHIWYLIFAAMQKVCFCDNLFPTLWLSAHPSWHVFWSKEVRMLTWDCSLKFRWHNAVVNSDLMQNLCKLNVVL